MTTREQVVRLWPEYRQKSGAFSALAKAIGVTRQRVHQIVDSERLEPAFKYVGGKDAYEARLTRMSWDAVAEQCGYKTGGIAHTLAKSYADHYGLDLPHFVINTGKWFARVEEAQRLREEEGLAWSVIAERLGYTTGTGAAVSVYRHKKRLAQEQAHD